MLQRLEGKSRRTMAWRAHDPQQPAPVLLLLPRQCPASGEALRTWQDGVRRAGRVRHPQLAELLEVGQVERWPYVQYRIGGAVTLGERLRQATLAPAEAARFAAAAAEALACAHDAGIAHHDLQPYCLLLDDDGRLRLAGLAAGAPPSPSARRAPLTHVDALQLQAQRTQATDDVLALGLLLHHALAGEPAFEERDVLAQIERLPPTGREFLRLPWNPQRPVPEALRAIVNRATDRQPRQRYRNARSLQRALQGWLQAEGDPEHSPLALLVDQLHAAGTLPAAPGAAERTIRLARMDRQHTGELAEVVLEDAALAFELLRIVNGARMRELHALGHGPVLTVRRAIALLGLEEVQRAAQGLRAWPGPLDGDAAKALHDELAHARRCAGWARQLRPPGYDAEVVGLITLLHRLGRLVCAYHLPDELQQIERLTQAVPDAQGQLQPGMDEAAAACAVLGCDLEALGVAVLRHWGLGDDALTLLRPLPATATPRRPDDDAALLRAVASCANECGDAMRLAVDARRAVVARVAQRYARVLRLQPGDLERLPGLLPGAPRSPAADAGGLGDRGPIPIAPPDSSQDAANATEQAIGARRADAAAPSPLNSGT